MIRHALCAVLGLALSGGGHALGATCGALETPCEIEGGIYHIAVPDGDGPFPVVMFLHGYGGSGASSLRNKASVARYHARGYALIAPTGQGSFAAQNRNDWSVRDGFDWPRDDVEFLDRVLDDALGRFDLDAQRILVAGFSRGGSMTWDYACARPDRAAGFAAVAGAFWEPMVTTCAGPVHLNHTHGFGDGMVPLEGRAVTFGGFDFVQGNVLKGIEVWRQVNGCPGRADTTTTDTPLWTKTWTSCASGSLTLQVSPGGHGIPKGWSGGVLDWFETIAPSD